MRYTYSKNPNKSKLVKDGIKAWYKEVNVYNYNKPGFALNTGHFTALVWKASKALGLGLAINGKKAIVAATFFPRPNYANAFPENVLPAKY